MKPYYEHGGVTIYHGDCRDVLPQLEGRADLVLTDPPYGHGTKWSGGTWAADPIYDLAFQWDARPVDDSTIVAVMCAAPLVIVWGGNYYAMPPSRCWLSWEKPQKMETMADFELAWTNMDRPSKSFRESRNPDGKREHPTQKPLSLMRWCLGFAPHARLVLDPFMGSGTTLRAAKDAGLNAVGIDIHERYCEIAAKRLQQETLQFDSPAHPVFHQEGLPA
jgi:DNA modification methylase